ncbi:hypothetical protein KDA_55190 [Dictyobacter alpinus]|uniref:Uncharacterized protein n=1 Tax=Dictyobacter alpinus TaxID=2014873 RepID=A0A402BF70_9CHLR|nr:hypothetical protein KDA_55190 [Dictyobacter alpinus]
MSFHADLYVHPCPSCSRGVLPHMKKYNGERGFLPSPGFAIERVIFSVALGASGLRTTGARRTEISVPHFRGRRAV